MKKNIFVLLIMICVTAMYPQLKNDKYDAINTYLSLIVKDTTKTVVLVKEKISANKSLRLFCGGELNDIPHTRINGIQVRVGGILEPLYDENEFQKMRKKYQDDKNEGRFGFEKNVKWDSNDFKLKNIYFEVFDTIFYKMQKGIPNYSYTTQVIALSEPMYYKEKKYLVIAVSIGDTTPLGYINDYVVVMKKIKNKWLMVQRGEKYWFD
ncbi:hypothetical protein [Flavobacterium tructae]|uniref:hypothetical protein n=1 Tax=Flavobacterium tructae TaxID=1114873 RepID=UPI0035A8381F